MKTKISCLLCLFLITACATSGPPSNSADVCKIFKEKKSWYKAAKRTEDQWNIPVSVTMAIIKQESSFISAAKPPRKKILGFIPWKRQSSAKGYAQVIDGTWEMYLKERSEEHTSELQSLVNLVCRLLLEKKKSQTSKTH